MAAYPKIGTMPIVVFQRGCLNADNTPYWTVLGSKYIKEICSPSQAADLFLGIFSLQKALFRMQNCKSLLCRVSGYSRFCTNFCYENTQNAL